MPLEVPPRRITSPGFVTECPRNLEFLVRSAGAGFTEVGGFLSAWQILIGYCDQGRMNASTVDHASQRFDLLPELQHASAYRYASAALYRFKLDQNDRA